MWPPRRRAAVALCDDPQVTLVAETDQHVPAGVTVLKQYEHRGKHCDLCGLGNLCWARDGGEQRPVHSTYRSRSIR